MMKIIIGGSPYGHARRWDKKSAVMGRKYNKIKGCTLFPSKAFMVLHLIVHMESDRNRNPAYFLPSAQTRSDVV